MTNPLRNLPKVNWEGRGIRFPFGFENGRVATSSGTRHIDEAVQQVLATCIGERVSLRGFGCDACYLPFEPSSPEIAGLLQMRTQQALATHEPRVYNVEVRTNFNQQTQALQVELAYSYRYAVTPGHQLLPTVSSAGGTRVVPPPSSGTVVRERGDTA